jgi:hypothetical protein
MRWTPGGQSEDVEDRRSEGGGGLSRGPRLGLGGVLVLLVLSVVFKQNFFTLLGTDPGAGGGTSARPAPPDSPEEQQLVKFVSFVIDDIQATWGREMQRQGQRYSHAKLVLFTDTTRSGCGYAESAMGPFYCPADHKVYVDLGFYRELKTRFGAAGDFAQAYVIAHEVGHHVQSLLGIEERMRQAQERRPDQTNALSVRLELQADCLAGMWGHSTSERGILENGDVEEGLGAAAAVGDDRILQQAGRRANPESFTHGSSKQRAEWFRRGFDRGELAACDTFAAS